MFKKALTKKKFDTAKKNKLIPGVFYFANFFRLLLRGLLDPHQLIMPTIFVAPPSSIHIWITYLALLNTCLQNVYIFADTFACIHSSSLLSFNFFVHIYTFFFFYLVAQSTSQSVAVLLDVRNIKSTCLCWKKKDKNCICYVYVKWNVHVFVWR